MCVPRRLGTLRPRPSPIGFTHSAKNTFPSLHQAHPSFPPSRLHPITHDDFIPSRPDLGRHLPRPRLATNQTPSKSVRPRPPVPPPSLPPSLPTNLLVPPSPARLLLTHSRQLYALYKIATVAPQPPSSRPALWDFAGRAKWDSWAALGKEGAFAGPDGRGEAEREYQAEAGRMGWTGTSGSEGAEDERADGGLEGVGKGSGIKRGKKEVGERMVHVSQMEEEEIEQQG